MYVYNIRSEFQMKKQRDVVSNLHRKGMKLPAIVAELAAVYRERNSTKTELDIGYIVLT
jgi:DNA-binding winged helix-turn-helix (wHTH) protein